jgi:hypothetical protein
LVHFPNTDRRSYTTSADLGASGYRHARRAVLAFPARAAAAAAPLPKARLRRKGGVTMPKRMQGIAIAIIVLLLAAGALWAEYAARSEPAATTEHRMMAQPEATMMPVMKEFDRCTMTCTLLMDNYQKKYSAMRAHEGDKQCWKTCWSRFGMGENPTAEKQKEMWMTHRAESMHANQCAQACWRVHHDESKEVMVGGWRSNPRGVVCAK